VVSVTNPYDRILGFLDRTFRAWFSKFITILKFLITLQNKFSAAAKPLTYIQSIRVLISDRVLVTYNNAKIDSLFHPLDVTVHTHLHSVLFFYLELVQSLKWPSNQSNNYHCTCTQVQLLQWSKTTLERDFLLHYAGFLPNRFRHAPLLLNSESYVM
jgi:hypothetical protein